MNCDHHMGSVQQSNKQSRQKRNPKLHKNSKITKITSLIKMKWWVGQVLFSLARFGLSINHECLDVFGILHLMQTYVWSKFAHGLIQLLLRWTHPTISSGPWNLEGGVQREMYRDAIYLHHPFILQENQDQSGSIHQQQIEVLRSYMASWIQKPKPVRWAVVTFWVVHGTIQYIAFHLPSFPRLTKQGSNQAYGCFFCRYYFKRASFIFIQDLFLLCEGFWYSLV